MQKELFEDMKKRLLIQNQPPPMYVADNKDKYIPLEPGPVIDPEPTLGPAPTLGPSPPSYGAILY